MSEGTCGGWGERLRGVKGNHPVLSVGTHVFPFSSVLACWGSLTDFKQLLLNYILLQNKLHWNIQDQGRALEGGACSSFGVLLTMLHHGTGVCLPKEGVFFFLICSPVGSSVFPLLRGCPFLPRDPTQDRN